MNMKKIMILVMVAAFVLPTMAQEWQSTSTMQGTGSSYTPQVMAVGATEVIDMATTTESYSPAKAPGGPKKSGLPGNPGHEGGDNTPIGDAMLPLLLMATAFAGVIYVRKRKNAHSDARVK